MSLQIYCVYLTALAVGMLTPGPAMLQALTLGMRFGPRPVAAVALGNVCASLAQVAACLYGLSFLARQPELLRLAGLAGGAYLLFLGLKMWRTSGVAAPSGKTAISDIPSQRSLFAQGAFVAAINPKAWGFLAALLPPFVTGALPDVGVMSLLAAPIGLLAFGGMMAYALCGARLTQFLSSPASVRQVFRLMAILLWLCALYFTQ